MLQKVSGLFTVLLGGILLFGACEQESDSGGGGGGNTVENEAFFPVVDALSSASILRVDSHTMVYVGDGYAGNYSLNRVDLDDPTTMSSRSVGRNVSVIAADTDGKRIGVIEAVEIGYETFIGLYTKIYAADTLEPLKTFPLARRLPTDAVWNRSTTGTPACR
jgi:hypothetical protein